jgi:hypothetical protein
MAAASRAEDELKIDGTIRTLVSKGNINELRRLLTNPASVKHINVKSGIVSFLL